MGKTDAGAEIAPNDPNWARLQEVALAAAENPDVWLAMEEIYGEVGRNPDVRSAFATALNALVRDGTAATLRSYISG